MVNTKNKKKLTTKQAIFAKEIAKGKTQRQACIMAYPNTRNWTINALDVRASTLMKNETVKEELKRLKEKEDINVLFSKAKSTKRILKIVEKGEEEIERLKEVYTKMVKIKQQRIENLEKLWLYAETDKEHLQIEKEILEAKQELLDYQKKPIFNATCTNAIINGLTLLNNMYGWKDLGWENFTTEEEKE